jgi:hypothetical protein
LFFDTFATSYAGTVIAHERTTPRVDESLVDDSPPPLCLSVPLVRKGQVSGGQD